MCKFMSEIQFLIFFLGNSPPLPYEVGVYASMAVPVPVPAGTTRPIHAQSLNGDFVCDKKNKTSVIYNTETKPQS